MDIPYCIGYAVVCCINNNHNKNSIYFKRIFLALHYALSLPKRNINEQVYM